MNITIIPVLSDNYIFVLRDEETKTAAVIDPAEAEPVIKFLEESHLVLTDIFLTHHHADHTGGVKSLKRKYPGCAIYGFKNDQHRLPTLTRPIQEGDAIQFGKTIFNVWHIPGHTTGHVAYVAKEAQIAFTGDIIFGMGCGRLFEGSAKELFLGMQRLKTLNPDTQIYCTHEYTVTNGYFAAEAYPENQAIARRLQDSLLLRSKGQFTVPLSLGVELNTNPFLLAEDAESCGALRKARDTFVAKEL